VHKVDSRGKKKKNSWRGIYKYKRRSEIQTKDEEGERKKGKSSAIKEGNNTNTKVRYGVNQC
jgi:hypothetical protein